MRKVRRKIICRIFGAKFGEAMLPFEPNQIFASTVSSRQTNNSAVVKFNHFECFFAFVVIKGLVNSS